MIWQVYGERGYVRAGEGMRFGRKQEDAKGEVGNDVPQIVIPTPVILSGVNSSPKNHAETTMVVTSLAIPAMDIGTTPARLMILII